MARTSDRLTICLPTYNGEKFLEDAVRSLLEQEFGDFALVIADNASTDGTRDIAERLVREDPRVSYLPSRVNRGAAWNFNRIVGDVRTEYFKWAADDDTYQPGFTRACIKVLDDRPDASVAYTQASEIDGDGKLIEYRGATNVADLAHPADRFQAVLLHEVYCYAMFGVMRTAQLSRTRLIGPFAQSDRVLLAELALRGRFVEVADPLFNHREHPGRSMYAYRDDRERLRWFDPSRDGTFTLPRWRIGAEYARALALSSDVAASDRVRSALRLVPWTMANSGVLSREVVRTAIVRGRRVGRSQLAS